MGVRFAVLNAPRVYAGGSTTLSSYLLSLTPTLYCRFNEVSGNLINYGSDGNSGTVSGATQGQTGLTGANEAYLSDGVDDITTFASALIAATNALTTQRWLALINPASMGEGGAGRIAELGANLFLLTGNQVDFRVTTDTVSARAVTSDSKAATGSWYALALDFDNANALGLGRKIRIFKLSTAGVELLTLGTDTAATGTVVATTDLLIGNNAGLTRTFAGLMDELFIGAGLWSPAGNPASRPELAIINQILFGV